MRYGSEGALILWGLGYLFYHSMLLSFLFAALLPFYLKFKEKALVKKQKQTLLMQFKEGIVSLAAALKAGYSIENALREAEKDVRLLLGDEAFITKEFQYMAGRMELNFSFEELLDDFADRSGIEDIKSFSAIFLTAKRRGGDFIGIVEHTVKNIGEKIEIKQEIETILSAKQLEQKIMSLIPLGMIVYMQLSFPHFSKLLYKNPGGIIVMTVCLMLYLFAFFMGKRIVGIEV